MKGFVPKPLRRFMSFCVTPRLETSVRREPEPMCRDRPRSYSSVSKPLMEPAAPPFRPYVDPSGAAHRLYRVWSRVVSS